MKASEVEAELKRLRELHGDLEVAIDDGLALRPIDEIDCGCEEDDCIVLWMD